MKKGEHIGSWEIVADTPLGRGGNSIVFEVLSANGETAAIKILSRFDRYERFKAEVAYQRKNNGRKGFLPLIDAYLPDVPTKADKPWLVTPIAECIANITQNSNRPLLDSVEIITDIAATLTEIHEEGAAHRDIKPENLFRHNEKYVLGDFGLVTFPDKRSFTEPGERIGPIYYVAPELLGNDHQIVDFRPGDVYSLAKTLWVLCTGQRFPLPGHLSSHESMCKASTYIKDSRAIFVDRLLDRATKTDPNQRPTAREFHKELLAILALESQAENSNEFGAEDVAVLKVAAERSQEADKERERLRGYHNQLLDELEQVLARVTIKIEDLLGSGVCEARNITGNSNYSLRHFPELCKGSRAGDRMCEVKFKTVDDSFVYLCGGVKLNKLAEGKLQIDGGIFIRYPGTDQDEVFPPMNDKIILGSASQELAIARFENNLMKGIPKGIQRIAKFMQDHNART